jgi:hypothetical protein
VPGELPSKGLVAVGSGDPQTIGVSLEARLQSMIEFQEEDAEFLLLEVSWDATQRIKKLKESKRDGST